MFHTGFTYSLSRSLSGKNSGPESGAGGKHKSCSFYLCDVEQSNVVDYLDSPWKWRPWPRLSIVSLLHLHCTITVRMRSVLYVGMGLINFLKCGAGRNSDALKPVPVTFLLGPPPAPVQSNASVSPSLKFSPTQTVHRWEKPLMSCAFSYFTWIASDHFRCPWTFPKGGLLWAFLHLFLEVCGCWNTNVST